MPLRGRDARRRRRRRSTARRAGPRSSPGARVFQTYGMTETCGGTAYDGVPLADVDVRIGDGGLDRAAQPDAVLGLPRTTRRPRPRRSRSTAGSGRATSARSTTTASSPCAAASTTRSAPGGETVWPEEVEAVLRAHPAVADVAVAGRPDPEWGEPRRGVGGAARRRRPALAGGPPRALPGAPGAVQGAEGDRGRGDAAEDHHGQAPSPRAVLSPFGQAPEWMKARAREGFARAFGSCGPPRGWRLAEGFRP